MRRVRGGVSAFEGHFDGLKYPADIVHDLTVPKSKNLDAGRLKVFGSLAIIVASIIRSMSAAIQFDDEFCAQAAEINDVGPQGLLPAKFQALEDSISKRLP